MTLEEDMVSDQQSRPRIENTIEYACKIFLRLPFPLEQQAEKGVPNNSKLW